MSKARIAMLVVNSVSHDARVTKEAASLARAGHDVTILGLADARQPALREDSADGYRILRLPISDIPERFRAYTRLVVTGAGGLVVLASLVIALVLAASAATPSAAVNTILYTSLLSLWVLLLMLAAGVGLYFCRRSDAKREWFRRKGIQFPPSPLEGLRRRAYEFLRWRMIHRMFVRRACELAPEIVHCHDLVTLPYGVSCKKKIGCRVVYDSHEIYEELSMISEAKRRRLRKLQARCSGAVDGFVTINDSIAALLRERYPRLPEPAIVMNATDLKMSEEYDGRLHAAIRHESRFAPTTLLACPHLPDWLRANASEPGPARAIWRRLSAEVRRAIMLNSYDLAESPFPLSAPDQQRRAFLVRLASELSDCLYDPGLADEGVWRNADLSPELLEELRLHTKKPVTGQAVGILNRRLLATVCPALSDDRKSPATDGRKILLYQGGFAQFRGLDTLVRAGAMLPDDWLLVMMGWGNYEPHLRAVAKEVDPERRRVRFVPGAPREQLPQWTAGATVGVIPYENVCLNHWFCTPNKLWEYPVAGVPILASPFPEMSKIVEGFGIGWTLEDPLTAEGIASKVASLDDGQIAACKARCNDFIEQYNWSVYEKRLVDLYDGLANKSSY